MNTTLTKSNFLIYLQCPAYFWFYKHKPTILAEQEISEFQQGIINSGIEVEEWARKLFPKGKLVTSRQQNAIKETEELLKNNETQIFQATKQHDNLYAMVDILEYDPINKYWVINEVKGTTSKEVKKLVHLQDATFQYIIFKNAGMNVGKVNLIELNKNFRKDGEINVKKLIKISDVTDKVKELESEINLQIADMKRVLAQKNEPAPCDCIYKSRANHCPAFKYLHPDVPDYGVHDIVRIGSSLKNLEALVEGGNIAFEDVPADFKLSFYQRNHVDAEQTKIPLIDPAEIKRQLDALQFPLYFLDYETMPAAVPVFDGCKPFQQVPFQYSLHVLSSPGAKLEHYEYLHVDGDSHPMRALADSLMKVMGESGNIVVWNKKFEGKCHEDLAELMPQHAEVFHGWNKRMYDLADIFSKHHYYHHDFKGSFSIKAVLPVLVPSLSYKNLAVRDGSMAMTAWKKMMFGGLGADERSAIGADLLEYCKLDTLAMVKIWEAVGAV